MALWSFYTVYQRRNATLNFTDIYIPRDFTEETFSIGTLSMESSSVSDRVLNL